MDTLNILAGYVGKPFLHSSLILDGLISDLHTGMNALAW